MLTDACSHTSPSRASSIMALATLSGSGNWIGLPFHAASAHHAAKKIVKLRSAMPLRRSQAGTPRGGAGTAAARGIAALIGPLIS